MWIIPTYLPHRMCVWSSFDSQQRIDTWRSGFKQETDGILLASWSKRQRTSRSWTYWLLCTTSSTILAQFMEETSRRGILGWYWSCDSKGIDILSDSIEGNYPPRNTSSLLYSKSCEIEDWRSLFWEIIHVSSTTTKDLIETIGPEGMINWALQLNNSQSVKLFDSLVEKFN